MKKQILSICLLLFTMGAIGQTILFNEDFEGSTLQFTSTAAISTSAAWSTNTSLFAGGNTSIVGPVTTSDTLWLTSDPFSTMGSVAVNLSFSHICKVDFFDRAFVQYSINNGQNWTTVTTSEYLGAGNFFGNSFSAISYLDWLPGSPSATPTNAWWKRETINLAATANNMQVRVRFALIDGDNNGSLGNFGWLIDDVNIIGANCELIAPVLSNEIDLSGFQYTTSPLAVGIDAFDNSGIDSVKVFFTVNSNPLDSVALTLSAGTTYNGFLPGFQIGDTVCYYYQAVDSTTCKNTSQLPNSSCYQFIVQNLPPIPCLGTPTSIYPFNEDFSNFSLSSPFVMQNNWENSTTDDIDWQTRSGGTPSTGTGPSGDRTTGFGNYLYIEATGAGLNDEAHLITPCYDLTTLGTAQFSFWYHMFGVTMGALHLDIYVNNGWTLDVIPPLVGNQGNSWINQIVDLRNYVGQVVKFRFRGIRGNGFASDIAIDDIQLIDLSGSDVRVDSISVGTGSFCQNSSSLPVEILIQNTGSNPESAIPVAYRLNNGQIIRDTTLGTIAPGTSQSFVFTQQLQLVSPTQNYVIESWTELSADIAPQNDSTFLPFQITPTVSSYPFTENFDTFIVGSPGTLFNGWQNDATDDLDWNVNSGPTGSANTGPSQDQNSTAGNGNYLYVETSGSFPNATALLTSNCIDLTGINSPQLSFWYHMFGAAMGELHLDLISNGVLTLDIMTPIIGNQGDVWRNQTVDLSPYIGQVIQLRFRGIRGTSFTSDIAIDNLSITATAAPSADAGITNLITPVFTGCQSNPTQAVRVSILNFTNLSITETPVAYQFNGGPVERDTLRTALAAFGSSPFSFSIPVTAQNGINDIVVWTEVPGDTVTVNDTLRQSLFFSGLVSSFPSSEDFDAFTTGAPGVLINGWENEQVVDSHDWYVNSGATPTVGTGPSSDHTTGAGNYMYVNSNGFSGTSARLYSRCFDLTNANQPILDFWYHMDGADVGTLHVDLDINGFYVQDIIVPISGNQGANWVNQQISLSGYPSIVRVVFRADVISKTGTIAGDIAIDDVNVTTTPVGIDEAALDVVIGNVYPNPTNGNSAIDFVAKEATSINYQLIDVNGRTVLAHAKSLSRGKNTLRFEFDEYEKGVYFLRLVVKESIITKKVIVQ
jgi:hypothetical protein